MAGQCLTHRRRLQRIHGLTDRGCTTGHGGNEPVRGRLFEVANDLPDLRPVLSPYDVLCLRASARRTLSVRAGSTCSRSRSRRIWVAVL